MYVFLYGITRRTHDANVQHGGEWRIIRLRWDDIRHAKRTSKRRTLRSHRTGR